MSVEFRGWKCRIAFAQYSTGAPAMILVDEKTGELITKATIYVEGVSDDLEAGHAVLKDYSENEGLLQTLCDAEVVHDTGLRVRTGYVDAPIVRLEEMPA